MYLFKPTDAVAGVGVSRKEGASGSTTGFGNVFNRPGVAGTVLQTTL